MLKNYFKTAWRNLWKNKVYSFLNIAGLAIGLAACIVILLFVLYENSFDNFHSKNIYRLNEVQKFEGMVSSQKVALSMFPMGPALKNDFPEIKNFTRIQWTDKLQMTYGEKRLYLDMSYFVDSTFLQMFDFQLLQGNRESALQKPKSAVLTQDCATRLFGKENPMGKTITHYAADTMSFVVTGVLQNPPKNSQLQFDALFSFSSVYEPWMFNNWGGNWLNTFLELAPNTNVASLEKKFPGFLQKYMTNGAKWKHYELFLLPLKDVHSRATDIGLDNLNFQKFDRGYTNIFFAIALIVLVIACINFMNLSTARSAERAREVGVRKSIGANRFQLSVQFISESVIISVIALVIAIILVELSIPSINSFCERNLQLPFMNNKWLIAAILPLTVFIGTLSGLYPAAYLSSFNPVKVLKGGATGSKKSLLRNVLVVTQFSTAIFLMIATIFAVRQLNFMRNRNPGFNHDQVVTIPLDDVTSRKFDLFKEQLLKSNLVAGVTGAQDVLGSHLDQSTVSFIGDGPKRSLVSTRLIVDHDYLTLYQIQLASGRNFSAEPSAGGKEYIINEALAAELMKDEKGKPVSSLLGKHFGFDSAGTIVGIAKDFNFNSLHHKIETMFLFNQKGGGFNNMSVKLSGNPKNALAYIQSTWNTNFPDHPFEYHFLDEHFEEIYRSDAQVGTVVGSLATLAIIISCLGLFGLASYSAEQRTKEMGIRKVLGASVNSIVNMLSKDFLKYVIISALIALPLAWLAINNWLADYAYRVNLSWWIFILTVIAAVLIAWITISFQAIRAAVANPVKSLRSE